jgi:Flp pilus assembly protein TadG
LDAFLFPAATKKKFEIIRGETKFKTNISLQIYRLDRIGKNWVHDFSLNTGKAPSTTGRTRWEEGDEEWLMSHHLEISKRWKSERGQNLVETAVVLIPLLLLTFAVIDFASLFYVYLALENGLSQATRYAVTGQKQPGTDPLTGNPYDRAGSIKKAMQNATPNLDLSTITYTFANITNPGGDPTGGPGDILKVTVNYDWNIITPLVRPFFTGGKIRLTVSSTMKNESFPP